MKKIEKFIVAYAVSVFIISIFALVLLAKEDPGFAFFWTMNSLLGNEPYVEAFHHMWVTRLIMILNSFTSVLAVSYLIAKITENLLMFDVAERDVKGKVEKFKHHIIICGAGRVGGQVIENLKKTGRGAKYVIIEKDGGLVENLRAQKELVIKGDATLKEVLQKAGVERAIALVACLQKDSENLFTVLTARELNSKLFICSRATSEDMEQKLKSAGANLVIMPEVVGGREIGKEALKLAKISGANPPL